MNDIHINTKQGLPTHFFPDKKKMVLKPTQKRTGRHKQMISNSVRFEPALAISDNVRSRQFLISEISRQTCFKTSYIPPSGFKTAGSVSLDSSFNTPGLCMLYWQITALYYSHFLLQVLEVLPGNIHSGFFFLENLELASAKHLNTVHCREEIQ